MALLLVILNVLSVAGALWGLLGLTLNAWQSVSRIQRYRREHPATQANETSVFTQDVFDGARDADALLETLSFTLFSAPLAAIRDFAVLGLSIVIGGLANTIPLLWTIDPVFG